MELYKDSEVTAIYNAEDDELVLKSSERDDDMFIIYGNQLRILFARYLLACDESTAEPLEAGHKAKKAAFIETLAEHLAGTNQVKYSIKMELNRDEAMDWAKLRSATPLFGYPTIEEATEQLSEFLA